MASQQLNQGNYWSAAAYEGCATADTAIAVIPFGLAARSAQVVARAGTGLLGTAADEAVSTGRALVPYYPAANGFLGDATQTTLEAGQTIDRYGGSAISRFFSPAGTPAAMRALPPGVADQTLRSFEVLQPFSVELGIRCARIRTIRARNPI